MSLVEKLPPLISALAFGYGVGMAAPEAPIQGVRSPFVWGDKTEAISVARPAPIPLRKETEEKLPGGESENLRALRLGSAGGRTSDERSGLLASVREREARSFYEDDLAGEVDDFEATSAAVSRLQLPDLGLGVSRQTLKYIRFFTKTDRGRGMFETWLKRSGRYQEMVQEELRSRELPEDLIWVAMIESGFDATAKSPVGAMGLWQFMPATGAVYGLKQNKFVDQRRNPKLATQAAAHHLRDLYLRFGQWDLALAAYNMGYEQLLERIDRVGTTDFNELVRAGVMPSETSKYVPKILAAAVVANNLERFDFDGVTISRGTDTAELAVPPRTPLDVIAKAAGVPTSMIRKLNPDILGKTMPPGRGDYLVNVPPESVSRAVAALPSMLDLHRGMIAEEDVIDPLDLMSPDGFRQSDADQNLLSLLPKPKKRRALRDPLLEDLGGLPEEFTAKKEDAESEPVLYRVAAGDSVRSIAKQFEIDPSKLARENDVAVEQRLKEGSLVRLRLPRDKGQSAAAEGDRPKAKRSGT